MIISRSNTLANHFLLKNFKTPHLFQYLPTYVGIGCGSDHLSQGLAYEKVGLVRNFLNKVNDINPSSIDIILSTCFISYDKKLRITKSSQTSILFMKLQYAGGINTKIICRGQQGLVREYSRGLELGLILTVTGDHES